MLTLLQTALPVIEVSLQTAMTKATMAASCLGIIGALILLVASHLEHGRTVRPSTLLLLYLGFSAPADALRARTLWSMPRENHPVAIVLTAFCACKIALFLAERGWKAMRSPTARQPTPDERADILSRVFIWWLVPLFRLGRKTPELTSEGLPDIEFKLTHPGDFDREIKGQDDESSVLLKPSIFRHLFAVRGWLLLSGIPPRLCYTGFTFAQPFLVQKATDFLETPRDNNTYKAGGGLIGAYLIVYLGIAVRSGLSHYF
jgi:hypothetical protein